MPSNNRCRRAYFELLRNRHFVTAESGACATATRWLAASSHEIRHTGRALRVRMRRRVARLERGFEPLRGRCRCDKHPDIVTRTLPVEPSRAQIAHVPDGPSGARAARRPNAWFLSSEGRVTSRDCRRHIDWLVEQIAPHRDALRALLRDGTRADVSCFWVSASGNGGRPFTRSKWLR